MTCIPTTFAATPNATSLPDSAAGPTPSVSLDGPTTSPSGPAVARANLSARQAQAAGLLTSGTYGHTSSTSLSSAALADALASRLRVVTASLGSTLYKLTWKARVTPQHRLIYALRASAPRTSVNACIGWPTPRGSDQHCEKEDAAAKEMNRRHTGGGAKLAVLAHLTGWPTPNASDGSGGGQAKRVGGTHSSQLSDHVMLTGWPTTSARDWHSASGSPEFLAGRADQTRGKPLSEEAFVQLAGWPTPTTRDGKGGYQGGRIRDGQISTDTLDVTAQQVVGIGPARRTASGAILIGSSAEMESGGQLAPAHSLWLMGFPPEWESSAPQVTRSSRRSPPSSSGRT